MLLASGSVGWRVEGGPAGTGGGDDEFAVGSFWALALNAEFTCSLLF